MNSYKKSLPIFLITSLLVHVIILGVSGVFMIHREETGEYKIHLASHEHFQHLQLHNFPRVSPAKIIPKPVPTTPKQEVAEEKISETTPVETTSEPVQNEFSEKQNAVRTSYKDKVRSLLESRKTYPRRAYSLHQQGEVNARIRISKKGKLLSAEIISSSKYKILDNSALETIKSISKYPEFPSDMEEEEITLLVPMKYSIKSGSL